MPMVEIFTRERLPDAARGILAESLTKTMIGLELETVTDNARSMSIGVFHTLGKTGLIVGGAPDGLYEHGRKFAIARVVSPEAFLDARLKEQAIAEITSSLRQSLGSAPQDDGSGIFVSVEEVPADNWGSRGRVSRLPNIISRADGHISEGRRRDMEAHFDGIFEDAETLRNPFVALRTLCGKFHHSGAGRPEFERDASPDAFAPHLQAGGVLVAVRTRPS
jgi:phenylpyruvate tautomerase PptA (4-oxalocrotonate tautomerase family)